METNMRHRHLSDENLATIVLGMHDSELWEQHLDECAECLERAAALDTADTFVELLANTRTRLDARAAVSATMTMGFDDTPGYAATMSFPDTQGHHGESCDPPPELMHYTKYRPLRKLGSGGMGSVWLVEHQVMRRLVAVKAIRPEFLSKSAAKDRFLREIRAVAHLQHPNIVTAYDAEEANGSCLLVMEYVPGEVLSSLLERGPLPVDAACRAVRDAALGLHRAHEAGLVHRDIKPSNLIRTPEGVVKVLDFGLVDAGEQNGSGLTGENVVMGTADYIAPEQAENATLADARSDIYSLGCTLYHLLAGRVPFPQASILKKLDAHRTAEPEPIAWLPQSLTYIVRCMMAKNPAKRFPTALAVAKALEPFCQGTPQPPEQPSFWRRWRTAIAAGLALALFGLAAAAVQYRIKTDRGELVIETVDEDVEVVIKQGGKVVTVYDPKSKQKIILQSGTYEFELDGKASGLKLDIDQATLKRGDVVIAKVTREREPAPAVKPTFEITPQPIRTVRTKSKQPNLFSPLSRDGRLLAVPVDNSLGTSVSSIRVVDILSGETIDEVGRNDSLITDAAFSADGNSMYFFSTSPRGSGYDLNEFDLKTRKVRSIDLSEQITRWPCKPIVSGDGQSLAFTLVDIGDDCRSIRIIDIASGKALKTIPTPFKDGLTAMTGVFSADGRSFLVSAMNRNSATSLYHESILTLHDLKTPDNLKTWTLESVAYDAIFVEGQPLIGAVRVEGDRAWFEFWNTQTKVSAKVIPAPSKQISYAMAWQGNRIAYSDSDGKLFVVNVADGQTIWSGGPVPQIIQLRISDDGQTLVAIDPSEYRVYRIGAKPTENSQVHVGAAHVAESLPPTSVIPFDLGDRFGTIDISADGRQVVATRAGVNLARVYDAATGRLVRELPHAFIAKFAADGKHVITADYDTMRVYDLETGNMLRKFGDGLHLYNVQPTASGTRLLCHCARASQIWDWNTGAKIAEFPHFTDTDHIFLSADGSLVFRQTQGKPPLDVFDVQTGKSSDAFAAVRMIPYRACALTPDNTRLVCSNDSEYITYNVATGKEIARFSNRQPATSPAASNPSKHRLLSRTSDRYMLGVYDVESGRKIVNLLSPQAMEDRHDYKLSASGMTAGMYLGNTLYIWDLSASASREKPNTTPDASKE